MSDAAALERVRACLDRVVEDKSLLKDVTEDTHLFEQAVLDSVATVSMVEEIEREFGLALTDADIFSDKFTTLRGLAELAAQRVRNV